MRRLITLATGRQQKMNEMKRILRAAVLAAPTSATSHLSMAHLYEQRGKLSRARKTLDEALAETVAWYRDYFASLSGTTPGDQTPARAA